MPDGGGAGGGGGKGHCNPPIAYSTENSKNATVATRLANHRGVL